MSVPVVGSNTPTKLLPTSASTLQTSINQQMPTTSSCKAETSPNLLLYENVKMKSGGNLVSLNGINNNGNSNVPYENINLEYQSRLMKEGYTKENVVAALGIARNNFEMACEILHEFVSTNHQHTAGKVCENNRWVSELKAWVVQMSSCDEWWLRLQILPTMCERFSIIGHIPILFK